jgi:hypothetical protein
MNCDYVYKYGSKTYICSHMSVEEASINGLDISRAPKIGDHIILAEIENGDIVEDGEEITEEGFLLKSSPFMDMLFAAIGKAPVLKLVRV